MPTFNEFFDECQAIRDKYSNYRCYILVREQYGPSVAINSAAHAAMSAGLLWKGQEEFDGWLLLCFRKVTCILNDREFEAIYKSMKKNGIKWLDQTESRLDRAHILSIVFPIDMTQRYSKAFKYLRLYKDE